MPDKPLEETPPSVKEPTALPEHKDEFAAYRHPEDASFDKFIAALDRAYHRPLLMMWRSFLQGVAYALGATVGAAIVFVLLFYILRTINYSPYIQDFQNLVIPSSIRNALNPTPTPSVTMSPLPTSPY